MKIKKINMRLAFVMLILVMLVPSTYAAICTVEGFVFDKDSNPVSSGVSINVTNTGTLVSYPTKTGAPWPYANYYSSSFSCVLDNDDASVLAWNSNYYGVGTEEFSTNPVIELNVTLDTAYSTPSELPSGGAGGGGGGGSGSKETETVIVEVPVFVYSINVLNGETVNLCPHDLVVFYTGDVSTGPRRHEVRLDQTSPSRAMLLFSSLQNTVAAYVGQPTVIELFGYNLSVTLNSARDSCANLTFKLVEEIPEGLVPIIPEQIVQPPVGKAPSIFREELFVGLPYWIVYVLLFVIIFLLFIIFLLASFLWKKKRQKE